MKKLLLIICILTLSMACVACGKEKDDVEVSEDDVVKPEPEKVPEEEIEEEPEEPVNEVTSVTFTKLNDAKTGDELASIDGFNEAGERVWNWTTNDYQCTELDQVCEIGTYKDKYYYVEGGRIVALNLADGKVAWSNDEFGGASSSFVFGDDGTLYICGYYGPSLFVVDKDGNTVKRMEDLSEDYYWPYEMELTDGKLIITFEGSPSEEPVKLAVNVSDFTWEEE